MWGVNLFLVETRLRSSRLRVSPALLRMLSMLPAFRASVLKSLLHRASTHGLWAQEMYAAEIEIIRPSRRMGSWFDNCHHAVDEKFFEVTARLRSRPGLSCSMMGRANPVADRYHVYLNLCSLNRAPRPLTTHGREGKKPCGARGLALKKVGTGAHHQLYRSS